MNYQKNKKKIIRELLQSSDKDLTDEELIDEILSTNVTESSNKNEKASFGQKAADAVAKFAGSWAFIFSFVAVMAIWMILNVLLAAHAFDAYPFILLNLVLSCMPAKNNQNLGLAACFQANTLFRNRHIRVYYAVCAPRLSLKTRRNTCRQPKRRYFR